MWSMYNLLPVGPGAWQTVGSRTVGEAADGRSWNMTGPATFRLAAPGSSGRPAAGPIDVTTAAPFATFSGVPYPGVNTTAPFARPAGDLTYGGLRMANREYLLTMVVKWNGLQPEPSPPHEGLLPLHGFIPGSVVAFTSKCGIHWRYSTVVANATWGRKYVHCKSGKYFIDRLLCTRFA